MPRSKRVGTSCCENHRARSELEEVARVLVRAERPGKAVRLNITLDEGLLSRIDRVASNRPGFLAGAARAALAVRHG